ncbi:MAG TPA: SigE family RNA polymerase sigma factor [Acidimicrobiales bacterium]|jgi:RNA polymerase sigma-70 factor (sigma-E family)
MSMIGETAMGPGDSVEDLFRREYPAMVGMASILLGGSRAAAEDVVQEAFVRMLVRWPTVADERAGGYLRTTVLNLARGRLRRERVAGREHRVLRLVTGGGTEDVAVAGDEHRRVMGALDGLPRRQRECAVLRYYLDYSEAEIAAALGVAAGSVKSHLSRARSALSLALEGH